MSKHVLVVDDEKDFVKLLLARLKAHGYDAASAGNGAEGLKMIRKEKFDLIILDIVMPVMDGTELCGILREDPQTKNVPVIFLTALGMKQKDAGYTVSGSEIVFAKPFLLNELLGKIDELLAA